MNSEELYILTNSHPVMSLATAHKYGIPSSHVIAHGHQLASDRLSYFDSKRGKKSDIDLFEEELRERSPLGILIEHREELAEFLDKLFPICSQEFDARKKEDKELVRELKKKRMELFDRVVSEDLRNELIYLLREEKGITGGENKAWALRRLSPTGDLIFLDDSIVGADGVAFATYGFAINTTNPHLLYACKLNLVVYDFSNLIPLFDDIDEGKFDFDKAKERYSRLTGLTIFTPRDVEERFDYVRDVNSKIKSKLKAEYKR